MSNLPNVSIITINLNNGSGLLKTIESVVNQVFMDYEFLVIDGASSDGSVDIIKSNSNRITYWVSEPDRGIYHAMNKGIVYAKGKYCLFLNSGDWLIDKYVLERCFKNTQTSDLLIGGCQVSKNGSIVHTFMPTKELTLQSFYHATIPHQATFIKKECFTQLGNYNESYKIHGDYDLWIRSVIINHCSITALDCVVADYNLEGISNTHENSLQSREEIQQILQLAFPKRVLADYEFWRVKSDELRLWEWIKSKKILYGIIAFIYNRAVEIVSLKRKLKLP
ncbi:glycosyltransferase family 2 protein [Larkinella bovis]|uniref:Glycosyltransferase family 2 protein n=1 Tax=Larkinella bovis TaxID=683041 RepID=A0ABW0IKU2_9BACT